MKIPCSQDDKFSQSSVEATLVYGLPRHLVLFLVALPALLLAACGGGSGGNVQPTLPSGAEPNSILISDMLISYGGDQFRVTNFNCLADGSCSYMVGAQTFSYKADLSGGRSSRRQCNTFRNHWVRWNHMVSGAVYIQTPEGIQGRTAIAGGDVHGGSLPHGWATWTGDMVGLDSNNRPVRGGAAIRLIDFGDPRVRVRLTPNAHPVMEWNNLRVRNGVYSDTRYSTDYIKGEFYGPNAEETGGVFERNGLIGAFGASK